MQEYCISTSEGINCFSLLCTLALRSKIQLHWELTPGEISLM